MPIIIKLKKDDLHKFITDFENQFSQTPGTGFLAGYYKVSKSLIHAKLRLLEKEGKIEKIKNKDKKYNTKYLLKQKYINYDKDDMIEDEINEMIIENKNK